MSILAEKILDVLPDATGDDPAVDWLDVMWRELDQRALARQTRGGRMVRIILPAHQRLEHGAVLSRDEPQPILINLLPCQTFVVETTAAAELASAAYAIGNLHLPAQIEPGRIILPAGDEAESALGRLRISFQLQFRRVRPVPDVRPQVTIAYNLVR